MAKNKNIQKSERESLNIKDRLFETLKVSMPEAFSEGKVNWDKLRRALGEHLDISADKFNFTWAGKAQAITNVLIPSKATLRPDKKESVKFDESENLFIEGDNLEVLKLLQKSYFEQVKMIYTDPPYNTGNDFVYKDDFKSPLKNYLEQSGQVDSEGNRLSTNTQASGRFHSDWLSMMYPRLKLAWNLLRHDGIIFVSIDDNEVHHLKMLMNEIFGEENFISELVWEKKYTGGKHARHYVDMHEYVLVYCKDIDCVSEILIDRPDEEKGKFTEVDKHLKERGKYYIRPLKSNLEERPTLVYPIKMPDGSEIKTQWLVSKQTFEQLLKDERVEFRKKKNGKYQIYKKYYERDGEGKVKVPSMITKFPNTEAKFELKALFNIEEGRENIFYTVKPKGLIRYLIEPFLSDGDIVLDFFAGTATTAHAVLELVSETTKEIRFICIQMPESTEVGSSAYKMGMKNIAEIAKERIRRVLKGYGDHKPISDGFKVFKLDKSNYYDNLFEYDPEKTDEENEEAFQDYLNKAQKELFPAKINEIDIIYESVIKEGLNLNAKIEETKIGKNKVYKVIDTERELFICLDEKLSDSAIDALTAKEYKEKIFVCFDGALNDSDKANLALNLTLKTI